MGRGNSGHGRIPLPDISLGLCDLGRPLRRLSRRVSIPCINLNFEFFIRHWWQYAVAIGIFALGFVFLYAGKIESVVIDKSKDFMEVKKTSVFCVSKTDRTPSLRDIHNIRGIKKGHEGVNFYTLHYVIYAEFRNKPSVKIMESQNRDKIVKQLVMMRNFLGMLCTESEVQIIDHSTRI